MKISIRPFASGDSITELTNLLHAAYAQLAALGFNYTAIDQTEEVTRERIADGQCYIAHDGERMVGTILFFDSSHTYGHAWYDRPEVAYFGQFGVLPSCQRRGIGENLLKFVEGRAVESGATELGFDTAESAFDLIGWYARRGYREVGRKQIKGKSYRSVVMSKTLAQRLITP